MVSRPKSDKKKSEAEEFEVLDVRETAKDAENLLRQIRKYLSKGSNSQQLAIGGVSGWYVKSYQVSFVAAIVFVLMFHLGFTSLLQGNRLYGHENWQDPSNSSGRKPYPTADSSTQRLHQRQLVQSQ